MNKFKPGDVVWRYTIGLTKCTIDKFVVQTEGQDSPAFLLPFIFYDLKADPDDGMAHKTAESALYASEEEARYAMLAEMKSARKHHETEILQLAVEMATHTEEIEHLDYLLDLYEKDNKETDK
jgi:hypothetical protein